MKKILVFIIMILFTACDPQIDIKKLSFKAYFLIDQSEKSRDIYERILFIFKKGDQMFIRFGSKLLPVKNASKSIIEINLNSNKKIHAKLTNIINETLWFQFDKKNAAIVNQIFSTGLEARLVPINLSIFELRSILKREEKITRYDLRSYSLALNELLESLRNSKNSSKRNLIQAKIVQVRQNQTVAKKRLKKILDTFNFLTNNIQFF